MWLRSLLMLLVTASTACSAAAPGTRAPEETSGERVVEGEDACGIDQWRSKGAWVLRSFPRWCEGQPGARAASLDWAARRGLRFTSESGAVVRRDGSSERDASVHALYPYSVEALTCADIREMIESSGSCGGVSELLAQESSRCASGSLMLDPLGRGESTRLGCAPARREQCEADGWCASAGHCSPAQREGDQLWCEAASDADCMKIDACRAEGLACRFDAEAGGCVVPGCVVDAEGTREERRRALWSERSRAWGEVAVSGEAPAARAQRLLAACQGLPPDHESVTRGLRFHEYPGGFVGVFGSTTRDGARVADVVRVTQGPGTSSFEHMATLDAWSGSQLSACESDPVSCFYDAESATFMTGEPVCNARRDRSECEVWAEREEAWAHDLGREDLDVVLKAHLGACAQEYRLGVSELQTPEGSMRLVSVSRGGYEGVLLLAQRVDDAWRFDVLEENYASLEGITSSSDARLIDDSLRHVFYPGPFVASFRYEVSDSATYGTFYEGEPACCEGGSSSREVEVFLTSSMVGERTRWTPALAVTRRIEGSFTDIDDDTTMSGSETTIAPIDARRWRLNTRAHAGKTRSRVIPVAPSKLEPLARCAAP